MTLWRKRFPAGLEPRLAFPIAFIGGFFIAGAWQAVTGRAVTDPAMIWGLALALAWVGGVLILGLAAWSARKASSQNQVAKLSEQRKHAQWRESTDPQAHGGRWIKRGSW